MNARDLVEYATGQQEAKVEEELRDLDHQLRNAVARSDAPVLARLIADDHTFTDPLGEVTNKVLVLAGIQSGLALEYLTARDVVVRVYGYTGVVAGRATIRGRYKEHDVSGEYQYSNVYMKRWGRWQMVATQSIRIDKR